MLPVASLPFILVNVRYNFFAHLTNFMICFNYLTAITIGVRILGPAAGFILGSFCTRLYVDLSDPGFKTSDPKWVGAWYLGKSMRW